MSEELQKIKKAVIAAVSATIEEMTFQPVEVLDGPPEDERTDETIWSLLPLIEPLEGEMLIEFPKAIAREQTKQMFGLESDSDVSDEMLTDSVMELVNTIGGRFLMEFVPPDQEFLLGLPKAESGDSPKLDDETVRIHFLLGERSFAVAVAGFDYQSYNTDGTA